ncbi:hypothetical protein RN001_009559 [Aquatica leii]|uniref:Drebrin-like protein n=1 Tax=Aquatica leii TaxID=1421715 RepID=A0AAN7QGH9_9COLE|nr:hypothetical protein RN001_009559 [Aquatica leii]
MAINLNKYREKLMQSWKDVLDDKTDTNWALFGYEGQTNDLKVVSTGSNGIEELTEDLNSGKIMYAFVKINDPKTSLPKLVLINWQGEGANTVRKGICANHLRDVEKFFTGAHLTINARNEEEVEPDLIINKVSRSGSAYSFKAPRSDTSGPTGPVGTAYQRVNPIKEINAKERDQFWLKEEQEEKKRIEEERVRKEIERAKREEEVKKRELEEAVQRDLKSAVRNNKIAQLKEAEKSADDHEKRQSVQSCAEESEVKVNQSDLLRQQRNKETQELISQRTIDARSIFEKNTAAGQIKRVPEKPVRNSLLKAQAQIQHVPEVKAEGNIVQKIVEENTKEDISDEESDQFSTIKRSPRDVEKKSEFISNESEVNNIKNEQQNALYKENIYSSEHMQQITDQQFVDEVIYQDFADGPGLQARALYDYQAADDTEITFDPGDIITNIDQVDEGWWQGLGPDGAYGLFPANYVELIQ